jgi:hypothetical protein
MTRVLPSAAVTAPKLPSGPGKAEDVRGVPLPHGQVKVSLIAQRAPCRRRPIYEQPLATRADVAAPERVLAHSELIIEMYENLDGTDKLPAKPPAGYEGQAR